MGRKKGFNDQKITKILSSLIRNPDGIWIRAIARETGISPNTVRHYIDTVLQPLIEDTSLGNSVKPLLRVVRLKPYVLQQLHEGKDIRQIMKLLDIIAKI